MFLIELFLAKNEKNQSIKFQYASIHFSLFFGLVAA